MSSLPKAVVAFAGARDGYQLPLALQEEALLEKFVTDGYGLWKGAGKIDQQKVVLSMAGMLANVGGRLVAHPQWTIFKDRMLSKTAGTLAAKQSSALFLYSYYAFHAFQKPEQLPYRFIFQVHPHPVTVRRLLEEELALVPAAQKSLLAEPDLGLPASRFTELATEPHLANGWVVASSYTAQSLQEQGIPADQIHVVPYGADTTIFSPRSYAPDPHQPLTILFLGSMVQRKGLYYLLEAVRQLKTKQLRLVLCGRGFRDEALLNNYADLPMQVRVGLSTAQLVQQIHQSDLMVFPSLVEGFAHVILETMACGVPVIATPHTCAPDLIEDGKEGYIVPIRDIMGIVQKLSWALDYRERLAEMGRLAAERAKQFTWERFRAGIRQAYHQMILQNQTT